MKSLILLMLLSFFSHFSYAQFFSFTHNSLSDTGIASYPYGKTQIGWYAGDYIHTGSWSFDIAHRWEGQNVFGFSFGSLNDHNHAYSGNGDTLLSGMDYRIYHKLYLMGTINDNFIYVRHGIRMKESYFSYRITDFFEFEEFGNTFLRKETRRIEEDNQQAGYEVVIGAEVYRKYFFLDFYFGAGHYTVSNKPYSSQKNFDEFDNDPRSDGTSLLIGFRTGIYLN